MQETERKPLFDLGQLVTTPGVLAALEKTGLNAMEFLSRHIRGGYSSGPRFLPGSLAKLGCQGLVPASASFKNVIVNP